MQKNSLLNVLLLPLGVFLLSLAPILIRFSEMEISPNATIFNRYWIATAALGLWYGMKSLIFKSGFSDLSRFRESCTIRDLAILFALAVSSLACLISWAWSLTQTSIANSNLLHNMTPIFATIGGWLFLNHRFDSRFLFGMTLALTGTVVIGIIDWQAKTDNLTGDGLALLSALFYAASYLIMEQLRTKFSATTILMCSCCIRSLLMLLVVEILEERIFPVSGLGWLTVIALAILCQIIGNGILIHSLKEFSSAFVSLVILLDPVITAILAGAIFAEKLTIANWFAFGVILTGIYLAKSGSGAEKNSDRDLGIFSGQKKTS